jgi:hypothetical protein
MCRTARHRVIVPVVNRPGERLTERGQQPLPLGLPPAVGIVTYAFGHHWSATLVGLDGDVPIVFYVPLMMSAILFGPSMDYEVFLMSHVRERWEQTGDPHRAVVEGLAGTGRVITSAALIMVSVFCAFIISGDRTSSSSGSAWPPPSPSMRPSCAACWCRPSCRCWAAPGGGCRPAWNAGCRT